MFGKHMLTKIELKTSFFASIQRNYYASHGVGPEPIDPTSKLFLQTIQRTLRAILLCLNA